MTEGDRDRTKGIEDQGDRYRALIRIADADSLHDLIAARGIEVLDESVPYILQALRWRKIDGYRRQNRAFLVDPTDLEHVATHAFFLDPAEAVAQVGEVADALAQVQIEDGSLLWWAAAGFSTRDQVRLWNEAGFDPENPSETYLRKRLSVARRELRTYFSRTDRDALERTREHHVE